jgi:hypothetical protein
MSSASLRRGNSVTSRTPAQATRVLLGRRLVAMSLKRRLVLAVVLAAVALTLSLALAHTGRTRSFDGGARFARATPACEASRVHYERFHGPGSAPKTLPWVIAEPHSVGLVGHLFYYDAHNPWGKRHLSGWRIYTGGESPDKRVSMKILWTGPSRISNASSLLVRGTRIAPPAHFSHLLDVGPSIVKVPSPGCWRLSLTAGRATTFLTVLAVNRS